MIETIHWEILRVLAAIPVVLGFIMVLYGLYLVGKPIEKGEKPKR